MKNLDFKTILIFILFVILIGVSYNWYFKTNPEYKKQVKELKKENKKIKIIRDSLYRNIRELENEFKQIKEKEDSLVSKILASDSLIDGYKERVYKSRIDLIILKREILEYQKKYIELKKNPPNRTGDHLITSLKNHSKK